ncbi:amino acid ABC transporter permease [Nocardioides sp. MAHUQ-72]|uniref:amino acid ABC transporter permease n=1 Tax=unclassified Nocardioides TaxID=2615069 RepID=UPI0036137D59
MRRTTRRRLTNGVLYAILVLAVLLLGALVDWGAVRANFFDKAGWERGGNWGDLITIGVKNTVIYTVIAFVFGFALAILLALMKLSPVAPYRWLATAYIEFFRGLPALIVILVMGFGVPIAFNWRPPGGLVGAGLIGLILVAGAYMAETLRAGIQAVPKGQTEAARSLGMGAGRTTVSVVLPQAFRIVIPPLTNEFVLLIKDTALLFVLGVQVDQRELTTVARDLLTSGPTAGTSTSLIQAALLYLVITLPLTRLVAALEKRQQRAR